ncbi:MAG: EamA family transporter, partial [Proteobacteria bacterium]|nr:EamA family transporter [Pseudomonadota bacterium]
SPWLYVALVFAGVSGCLYFLALRMLPLSVAGPIFVTLALLATSALGIFFFRESVSGLQIIGLSVCLIGVFLLLFDAARA